MVLKPRRSRDLRRELIDKAVQLIAKHGLDNLSLRELARKTGVTHQAPYRHFPTRADLLVAIALEGYEILRQKQLAVVAEPLSPGDDETVIPKRLLLCYARFALQHTPYYRVMYSADVGERKDRSPLLEAVRDTFQPIVEAIGTIRRRRGQEQLPSDYDVALSCWMLAHGTTLLYLDKHLHQQRGQMSLEELIIHLVRALRVGLPIGL